MTEVRPPASSGPRVGGRLVGYARVCRRKAWLALRTLGLEEGHEAVRMGQLLDRQSYPRRQGKGAMVTATAPDGTPLVAKLDGADLRAGVLHETKRGRSCEDAHVWQVRFYLWVLGLRGVTAPDGRPLRGRIDYPALRRTEPVELLPEHKARLAEIVADVRAMASDPAVPARFPRRSFCRRCAYEELCYA